MRNDIMRGSSFLLVFISLLGLTACSNPQPGPDKTIAGAVLGAGWGAGAGAVIGNQVGHTGEGAGIGAGFGAVEGMITGAGYDLAESTQIKQENQLASLKIQNMANGRQLQKLQAKLDHAITTSINGGVYQVFFDADATSLRSGAIANLEIIANTLSSSPHAYAVNITGHTDDSGSPKYNERLAQARARSVSAYLAARGISMDQMKITSYGSKRPIASNGTPVGRQLNRRVDIYIGRE